MAIGYDDPIDQEAADLLGRASFARELATLAVASPYGWSARIGVYGRWGEGKTSVVRLAQRYLELDGHLTADYNPWGCRDAKEMVSVLADTILDVAKDENIDVPGRAKRVAKRASGILGTATQKAENLQLGAASVVVGAAAKLSPWLKRWASKREEEIAAALEVIGVDRRLIVFVDDVDRLDPRLLPTLMFAVHEVFAIPGVTFVVALDPAVVGAALTEYHRGFGDGLAFLEKIVQFPRWLPPITEDDLLRVTEADRRVHAPFVSASVLMDNRHILPRNPRELRMLIRGLMPLRRAFERHDQDELDQNLLILLACFRQRFPQTLMRMLQNEELLDLCAVSSVKDDAADFASQTKALAVVAQELGRDETGERVSRFEQLVTEFVGRSMLWNAKHIRYHANLTDRPDALTWREFRALIAAPPATGSSLDNWMTGHASIVKAPVAAVARELFNCVVLYHNSTMDESATTGTAEAQADRVQRVATAVDVLRLLWFTSAHSPSLRTPAHFRAVVQAFRRWAHFDLNANDHRQRHVEATLLDEMAAIVEDPVECLATLESWERGHHQASAAAVTKRITSALVVRAAPGAIDRFAEPAGIQTMFRGKQYAAEYVLVQASPTWDEGNRRRLREHATTTAPAVADNVRLFVESLVDPQRFRSLAQTLLADRSLVELWWGLITSVRWQARFFPGLEQLLSRLQGNDPLPLPAWWEEARQVSYRDARKQDTPAPAADADDEDEE